MVLCKTLPWWCPSKHKTRPSPHWPGRGKKHHGWKSELILNLNNGLGTASVSVTLILQAAQHRHHYLTSSSRGAVGELGNRDNDTIESFSSIRNCFKVCETEHSVPNLQSRFAKLTLQLLPSCKSNKVTANCLFVQREMYLSQDSEGPTLSPEMLDLLSAGVILHKIEEPP
eukprot:4322057-Amphidinium_carterae.1